MRIANFKVQYLGHVCFLFTSPGGAVVITDPFFAREFVWQGHTEHYLTPPLVAAGSIRRCDAVFVSHIHGDHFDPVAVETIVRNTGAKVWAAPEITEILHKRGMATLGLVSLTEGRQMRLPGMSATVYDGYDNSVDAKGRPNKFALLLQAKGGRIFYSGDCHEPPPAMIGRKVDAVFSWPHPTDDKLVKFAAAFKILRFVLMHGDRFKPGKFWCNFSYEEHKSRLERLLPGVEVVIPERIQKLEG